MSVKLKEGDWWVDRNGEIWHVIHKESGFNRYENPMRTFSKMRDGSTFSSVHSENGCSEPDQKPSSFDIIATFPTESLARAYAEPWWKRFGAWLNAPIKVLRWCLFAAFALLLLSLLTSCRPSSPTSEDRPVVIGGGTCDSTGCPQ